MRDGGQQECIGAPRRVPTNKITRAPGEDGGQAENGGRGWRWQRHSLFITFGANETNTREDTQSYDPSLVLRAEATDAGSID